ncbi:MAG: endonuclease III [Candidatus Aenigmarchaeota archaeon]|nr:endonuclease III [Candidatus Aenigmarchaeota archaeon]
MQKEDLKNKAEQIITTLKKEYGDPQTALKHNTAHQLLVSTILSAQCTDKRVNIVAEDLFKKYQDIESFADADPKEFEKDIRSTGFYRNKAKNIINASKMILNDFKGKVPDTMENLIKLPGVARKTANIVLSEYYGKNEGIAVDTHVIRLSGRLGLTESKNPNIIEKDLMKITEKKDWRNMTNLLISHGRSICVARNPKCDGCILYDLCISKGKW